MELPPKHLKIMLAIALGVIIMLLLFLFRPSHTVVDVSQAQHKLDSLAKVHNEIKFNLTLNKKTITYLQKRDKQWSERDKQWSDTLTAERKRNKVFVNRAIYPSVVKRNQAEVDSALSARYKKSVQITPFDVAQEVVADLDVMDKALVAVTKQEKEISDYQQAIVVKDSFIAVKDSLNSARTKQDSLQVADAGTLVQTTEEQKTENDALKKDNKKLAKGNRFWKGVCKVLAGALVAVGFIAYTK